LNVTKRGKDLLRKLKKALDKDAGVRGGGFRVPRDLGATDGSHHSLTMHRMMGSGLVERRPVKNSSETRPRYEYRIKRAGIKALEG
jgi:hypothetical protein